MADKAATLQDIQDVQVLSESKLLKRLIADGIEVIHVTGLLAEELAEMSNDFENLTQQDLRMLANYLVEEMATFRQTLDAAVINQALQADTETQVFIISREDNLGMFMGKPRKAGDEVPISGRSGGEPLVLQQDAKSSDVIALQAIDQGEPLVFYGMELPGAEKNIAQGELVSLQSNYP